MPEKLSAKLEEVFSVEGLPPALVERIVTLSHNRWLQTQKGRRRVPFFPKTPNLTGSGEEGHPLLLPFHLIERLMDGRDYSVEELINDLKRFSLETPDVFVYQDNDLDRLRSLSGESLDRWRDYLRAEAIPSNIAWVVTARQALEQFSIRLDQGHQSMDSQKLQQLRALYDSLKKVSESTDNVEGALAVIDSNLDVWNFMLAAHSNWRNNYYKDKKDEGRPEVEDVDFDKLIYDEVIAPAQKSYNSNVSNRRGLAETVAETIPAVTFTELVKRKIEDLRASFESSNRVSAEFTFRLLVEIVKSLYRYSTDAGYGIPGDIRAALLESSKEYSAILLMDANPAGLGVVLEYIDKVQTAPADQSESTPAPSTSADQSSLDRLANPPREAIPA